MGLSTELKNAFTSAGLKLSVKEEEIVARFATAINWPVLLKALGTAVVQVLISLLGLTPTPVPAANKANAATCCPEHHCACRESLCAAVRSMQNSLCVTEQLADCCPCNDCEESCLCAFHSSLHSVIAGACTIHAAGHALMCCCCCETASKD